MRELKRSIAKARLQVMGVGNVNRKLKRRKDGRPLWRVVTEGKSGKDAERAQINYGMLLRAKKQERKTRRIIRKVRKAAEA